MSKPRLAIIGIGQYYRKLESAINEYFTPVVDAGDFNVYVGSSSARIELSDKITRQTP